MEDQNNLKLINFSNKRGKCHTCGDFWGNFSSLNPSFFLFSLQFLKPSLFYILMVQCSILFPHFFIQHEKNHNKTLFQNLA